jgi:P4 family phage/plasmid primase-like protien
LATLIPKISDKELRSLILADLERSGLGEREAKLMGLELLPAAELPFKTDAYAIPYRDIHGRDTNFRRFRNLLDNDAPKYQQLKDSVSLPYFEPVTKNWTKIAGDANQPINIVEGEKKSVLTALATSTPTIGLSGTDSWRSSKKNLAILMGLHAIRWKDRKVTICFDASNPVNPLVTHATYRLALFLQSLGAITHIVFLDALNAEGQTGPDDYAKKLGNEKLKLKFESAEQWTGFPLNDQGNALRFANLHGENLRCVSRADSDVSSRWYVWTDQIWSPDAELMRQRFAQTMPAEMRREAIERGADDKEVAAINQLCSVGRIGAFIKLSRSIPPIPARQSQFDSESTSLLLNCQNGTLELDSVRLREHRREDMVTRILPVKFNPNAKAPRWERALKEWTEDQDTVRTIQQLVGLSLTGLTNKHLFIIMIGDGQTGKTTFQEALLHLLAGYAGTISSDHLVLQKHNAPDERKAVKLVGLRFVSSSETKQGNTLDESFIKVITGGDTLTARNLYQESFDFKPQAKIWLRTNYPLTIRGTDNGIWRRIVQIPFAKIVSKPDRDLPNKLRSEAEGILVWAVRGWMDYVKNGDLYIAPSIEAAKEQYKKEQDVIGQFLDEKCEVGPEFSVSKNILYQEYKTWTNARGYFTKNDREFSQELTKRCNVTEKRSGSDGNRTREWRGVRTIQMERKF